MNRRELLRGGLVTLFAAPAIVRVASLMPVKAIDADLLTLRDWGTMQFRILNDEWVRISRPANTNAFLETIESQYGDEFSRADYKVGSQLRIRLP